MNLTQQLIFLFSGLGAFNGVALSLYFLVLKKPRRFSDLLLGGLLLMLSIRIIKSIFLYFNPQLFQLFVQLGLSACLLIGPLLYLYITFQLTQEPQLRKQWWVYLLPSLVIILYLSVSHPYTGPPNNWGPYVEMIYKFWLGWILAAGIQARHLLRKLFQRKQGLDTQDIWTLNIFFGVLLIYLAYELSYYTSYIVGALSFSFIFYLSVLLRVYVLRKQSIAHDPPLKYANSSLSEEAAKQYIDHLTQLMREEKLYLDPALTLTTLSDKMGITTKVLSQTINEMTGENYSRYVASLRVEEAKHLLRSPDYAHYKIAAIAYESGFNSLSSFNAAFKQITGSTPNTFRKNDRDTLPKS